MSHTHSVEARWRLPRSARSAGRARALLRERLAAWEISGEAAENAELLLSELVANAARHAPLPPGREIGVRLVHADGMLRLEVADADARRPEPRTAAADEEGGRGLALVAALAERWGCAPRPYGIGKTVWAELKTH
ncbi:ATP-binding protein [Streptomyces sp. NPDC020141]|uniref:ATP-binding protein n=1 Tax=Streptomyces sp. NPDC020141 TaxID=3365065 RepID=UPI0037AED5B2